jgi:hypothetical protein
VSFVRTKSGISNLHLFLNCEYVVFVEGGESISYEDIQSNKVSQTSIDALFWKKLFQIFDVRQSVAFRAVGSKATLKAIADDVKNNKVENTIVAMDSDSDKYLKQDIVSSRVLYTYGYSWENDAYHPTALLSVFTTWQTNAELELKAKDWIYSAYENLEKDLKRLVTLDVLLASYGQILIPRNSGHDLIYMKNGNPYLNRARIKQILQEKNMNKQNKYKRLVKFETVPLRDCYGKIIGAFGFVILQELSKKHGVSKSLPKDLESILKPPL